MGTVSAAQAEISTDKLSVSGFIDMSAGYTDTDGSGSESFSGLDQVELNISYDFGKLKAFVDIEHQDGDSGTDVEQAYLTYAVSDDFSIKAGRFLSYSGWETEEPTGLFQYSGTGYAPFFYGYYQQGVSALYSTDKFSAAVSIVNALAGPEATDSGQVGVETMLAFTPTENFTVKGFYSVEGDSTFINTWAAYSVGSLTLAAEYNSSEYDADYGTDYADGDADGYLLMANYGFESGLGLTVRYHDYSVDMADGTPFQEMSAITISPSYAVTDNLLIVTEYRMDSDDVSGLDSDSIAIEALVTF